MSILRALASPGLAFGVDPNRPERFSLRQARYDALATDIDRLAADAGRRENTLRVIDVGSGSGTIAVHLRSRPHYSSIALDATDIDRRYDIDTSLYRHIYYGDLSAGYSDIPSETYDVVVCEQVLEHIHDLATPISTLERLAKPGGYVFIGVPVFVPPLHYARRYLVPAIDKLARIRRSRHHVQAFSYSSFRRSISEHSRLRFVSARGFRIVSGGVLRPLENLQGWWALNRWIGERIPWACIEVQITLRKPSDEPQV